MTDAVQLSLFADSLGHTKEESQIEWSYSRRQTLEQCARRYYYDYYGAKVRSALADPQKGNLRILSTLSNRYLLSGQILHSAIRLFYKNGPNSREWLVAWAQKAYRASYEYSRAGGGTPPAGTRYRPKMLMEFHYRHPDMEALCVESEKRLVVALNNFLCGEAYEEIRNANQYPGARIEEAIRVRTPSFSARGKVDVAYLDNGRLTIVDWKTGEAEAPTESLQLAFYGLWAVETEGFRSEDVALYRGGLIDCELRALVFNEHGVQRTRARILQDLERMRVLDGYGRDAAVGVFPTCGLPRVCRLCPYQGICSGVAG